MSAARTIAPDEFEVAASGVWDAQRAADSEPETTATFASVEMPIEAPTTERTVLGCMMRSDPHALEAGYAKRASGLLTPDHFCGEANRQTFIAIEALIADGYVPELPAVMDRLRQTGRIQQVTTSYLIDVLQWASEDRTFDQSLEVLDDTHRRRRFKCQLETSLAHTRVGVKPIADLLQDAQEAVVELASSTFRKTLPSLGTRALSAPMGPIPWLCQSLRLAPGPISLVAGSGYSRKTLAMQSLALSVASGRPAWGLYSVRRGSVLHLDYEQGERLTRERYQRLAKGMGFPLESLADELLQVACMPALYLDAPGAEATLTRACAGKAFVLIDSMRAACPSTEENSSEARAPIDMLNRVSERTSAVIMLIHHAKKPPQDGSDPDPTTQIRGSGAIFDACAEVFFFAGKKSEPTKAHHQKDRILGDTIPDFGLDAEDVSGDGDPRWGLRVKHLDVEQMAPPPRPAADLEAEDRERQAKLEAIAIRLLEVVKAHPGIGKRELRVSVGGRGADADAAIMRLERTGRLVNEGNANRSSYRAT